MLDPKNEILQSLEIKYELSDEIGEVLFEIDGKFYGVASEEDIKQEKLSYKGDGQWFNTVKLTEVTFE